MERLGPYIFVFFFFGLAFFERARVNGETGSLWRVLSRNLAVLIFALTGFFAIGLDLMSPDRQLFETPLSLFGSGEPVGRIQLLKGLSMEALYCAAATLIVAVGIWELKIQIWKKWILVGSFNLLIYPVFDLFESPTGLLGKTGLYDHAGALLTWALPAAFVLGFRLLVPSYALPEERAHDMKGIKILPGMKHRFLFSRGIGFTMVFLVLDATILADRTFVISKTLALIPASFTILFCNLFFFGLFGRNKMERYSYAPPFFAVMGVLVSTRACNQYASEQAILAAVITTFVIMLYLRVIPLKVRFWDPICSIPIFLLGGIAGILMASITESAQLKSQIPSVAVCLIFGLGAGAVLSVALRAFRPAVPALLIKPSPHE